MKAFKIIFGVVGVLLVAAIAGATYLAVYLDRHKEMLADSVGAALGREVRIEKGVTLHWSMTPSIALRGLWVGNPDWADGEYLARAEQALLRVNIAALLQRRLDIKQVTVVNADLALEAGADGRRNWTFGEGPDRGLDLLMDALKVKDSRLSYRSPDGVDYRTDIAEIIFEGLGGKQLNLEARFSYQDVPVSASLTSRSLAISRAGERPFQGKVEMPGATLAVAGEFKGLFEFTNLEVELQSERLDLQKSVLVQRAPRPLGGSLHQVAGRFKTAGDSLQSLLGNLSGELKIAAADLTRPADKGAEVTNLVLNGLSLKVAPKQAVRLQTGLVYEKQTYQVELAGGLLEDLFLANRSWKSLKVKINGQVDEQALEISGEVGPLSALHSGRGVQAKLSVHRDDLELQLDGSFASLGAIAGSRFAVDASGPSLSRLNPLLGLTMPETPSFAMTAQIEGSERRLQLKKLKLTSGKSDISGELSLPLVQGGRIEGSLESRTLHLQTFLEHSDMATGDTQPLLERELSTGVLQGLDGSVQLRVRHLHMVAVELEQVSLDAVVDNGHLKLTMGAENERLTADADLKPVGTEWRLALNHKGKMDLGELIDRKKYGEDDSQAPLDIELHLSGTGKSLAGLLQSAKGQFTMVIGKGELSERISRHLPLGSVLYTLVGTLLPEDQRKDRGKLECAVIQLDIAKGIATSGKGLALRTDQMNVLGGGALNLRTGELDLKFKTARRKGLGIGLAGVADRLVGVTGTLDKPTVSLDVGSAATYGAAAWATAGLSVLADSIFTRMTAFSNPCDHVLKAIEK